MVNEMAKTYLTEKEKSFQTKSFIHGVTKE